MANASALLPVGLLYLNNYILSFPFSAPIFRFYKRIDELKTPLYSLFSIAGYETERNIRLLFETIKDKDTNGKNRANLIFHGNKLVLLK